MGLDEVTREGIDQLVFGYEEGHRLLGGSRRVSASALAALLGATDASVESPKERLVTGFPVDEIARYAVCFTWSAPELPRPGAVWSHVLLVQPDHFDIPGTVAMLRNLGRRPEPFALRGYDKPLSLSSDVARSEKVDVPLPLIESIAAAVYGEGGSVVVHEDLAEAEEALFAVWQAQWAKLQAQFVFRTRESARVVASSGIVVTRRVRGLTRRAGSARREAWIGALAQSIARRQGSSLQRFLTTYGPADVPAASTVAWLTRLYSDVRLESSVAVRDALESRYGHRRGGRELKQHLFGLRRGSWWSLSECSRLRAILGAGRDAWDLEALDLERRLEEWIRQHGVAGLLEDIIEVKPAPVRVALLNALRDGGEVADLAPVARIHPELAARWLVEKPAAGWKPETWQGLEHAQVRRVWSTLGSPDAGSVLAAAVAGHARAGIEAVGLVAALRFAAGARDFSAAQALVDVGDWSCIERAAQTDAEIALVVAAVSGRRSVPWVMAALESRREHVDEMWLRAAATAIASSRGGKGMEVVFGPLYLAIAGGRLPTESWKTLDRLLPEGLDPASRFRRLLVTIAKEEGWGNKKCRRALRGAGVHAASLYRELSDDGLLLGRFRRIVRRL